MLERIGSELLEVSTVEYDFHKVRSYGRGLYGAEMLPNWFSAEDYKMKFNERRKVGDK